MRLNDEEFETIECGIEALLCLPRSTATEERRHVAAMQLQRRLKDEKTRHSSVWDDEDF